MYNVRYTNIHDLDQIYEIECETYSTHHWSKKSFLSELANEYSKYLVCELESETNKIIGFTGYWIVGNEGHITTMAVRPLHRKKRVADILLYNLIKSAIHNGIKWLTLEVRVSNHPAVALYSKYRFKQLGIRKNYYQDNNEDALILWTDDITKPEYSIFLADRLTDTRIKILAADKSQYEQGCVPEKKN
jgi:ribosomal-protein-alanine N-acetyltransferase